MLRCDVDARSACVPGDHGGVLGVLAKDKVRGKHIRAARGLPFGAGRRSKTGKGNRTSATPFGGQSCSRASPCVCSDVVILVCDTVETPNPAITRDGGILHDADVEAVFTSGCRRHPSSPHRQRTLRVQERQRASTPSVPPLARSPPMPNSLGYSTRMEVEPGNCSTQRAPSSMLGV